MTWFGGKPTAQQPMMGPGGTVSFQEKSVCYKARELLGAICYKSPIMSPAHGKAKGAKCNFRCSLLSHPLKGWNTPEEPKKEQALWIEENHCSPSPRDGRLTPDANNHCRDSSARQTKEMSNGRLTRRGKFQPKVKRWPEENVNKGGCPLCHPSCTADEKQAAESQKWKRTQPKAKRNLKTIWEGVSTD